jgi:hypothetical protein
MHKIEIIYHSGIIIQLILEFGELTVKEIKEKTGLGETDIMLALGWLACERRVMVMKTRTGVLVKNIYSPAEVL